MPVTPDPLYQRFTQFTDQFLATHPVTAIDGGAYGLPGTVVYHSATLPLPAKGRLEVSVVTSAASNHFEWVGEITLNYRAEDYLIHLITRRIGDVVETYGKTVIPITPARAEEILGIFEQVQSAG